MYPLPTCWALGWLYSVAKSERQVGGLGRRPGRIREVKVPLNVLVLIDRLI